MAILRDYDSTAGDIYTLECSVLVTGSTNTPSTSWFDDDVEINSTANASRTVSIIRWSNGNYSSILTFKPLTTSDAGTYTCRVTLDGAEVNQSTSIVVLGKLLCMLMFIRQQQ